MSVPEAARIDLMAEAVRRFGHDFELIPGKTVDESFTTYLNKYVFWFNTPDNSTRCVTILRREVVQ